MEIFILCIILFLLIIAQGIIIKINENINKKKYKELEDDIYKMKESLIKYYNECDELLTKRIGINKIENKNKFDEIIKFIGAKKEVTIEYNDTYKGNVYLMKLLKNEDLSEDTERYSELIKENKLLKEKLDKLEDPKYLQNIKLLEAIKDAFKDE